MKALTREWLEYAEHDLYAAKLLKEHVSQALKTAEEIQELVNQYLSESFT